MGTKLTGRNMEPKPVIGLTEKEGKEFKGVLKSTGREVKLRRGKGRVYEFAVITTNMTSQLKNEKGAYENVDLDENQLVSIFAPKVLQDALNLAAIEDIITIKYLGKEQGKNGEYHNFDVEKE